MRQYKTLDDYKVAGAWMRLCKAVLARTHVECSKILNARTSDLFFTLEKKLDILCSRSEDEMFDTYPTLPNGYLDVFFGNLSDQPRTDTDQEIIELAKKLVEKLFGENWEK